MTKFLQIKEECYSHANESKKRKEEKEISFQNLLSDLHVGEEDEDDMNETRSSQQSVSRSLAKEPIDRFTRSVENLVNTSKTKQLTIDSKFRKNERKDAMRYIAKLFYATEIGFNAASLPSFKQMLKLLAFLENF